MTSPAALLAPSKFLHSHGVTLDTFILLCFVEEQGTITMGNLALARSATPSAATPFVQRLVKQGYVETWRVRYPEGDSRQTHVKLTDEGIELVNRARAIIEAA